eukprot:1161973-Pelagomonas_calceolata.AAC.3
MMWLWMGALQMQQRSILGHMLRQPPLGGSNAISLYGGSAFHFHVHTGGTARLVQWAAAGQGAI